MVNVERKDEDTNLLLELLAKAALDTVDMVANAGLGLVHFLQGQYSNK